jgi:lipoic acid synthetase
LKIKKAVEKLDIHNVVITSVTRDDLKDGGAGYFAECVQILRDFKSHLKIEVLVPDFLGRRSSIQKVVSTGVDIFSHNVETVPRLYAKVRPQADYRRSLDVLRYAKDVNPALITKSGLMVGLGETKEELYNVMKDLKEAGCEILTVGQYLKPASYCIEVAEFLHPEEFVKFSRWAEEIGFKKFQCSPFARSSYLE